LENLIKKKHKIDSNIGIEFRTNSTIIKPKFLFYFLMMIIENQEILVSEPFILMSYKELTKRKETSFLKKTRNIYAK